MKCNISNNTGHHRTWIIQLNDMEDYMIDDPFLFQTLLKVYVLIFTAITNYLICITQFSKRTIKKNSKFFNLTQDI